MHRIVFAGTPHFACPALEALIAHHDYDVVAVYTQPDRPAGRRRQPTASPVKQLAQQHNIPVEQPPHFKTSEAIQTLATYRADWMIVAAYGLILPQAVLDLPQHGCFNIHASLLPQWRGAAPVQRALLAGDAQTGVTIMAMALGLDTGDMLYKAELAIEAHHTSASLMDDLASLGATSLITTLNNFTHYHRHRTVQDDTMASYAHKLTKAEGRIDWHQPAAYLARQIRAFHPWPSSYSTLDQHTIKIIAAHGVENTCPNALPGEILACSPEGLTVATGMPQSGPRLDLCITCCQLPNKPKQSPHAIACGHPTLFAVDKQWQ